MSEEPRRPGCLRRSCCGCLVLLAAVALLAVIVAGVGGGDAPGTIVDREDVLRLGSAGAPGIIDLDISGANFSIVPVDAEQPLRVTCDREPSVYRLAVRHEPAESSAHWTWHVAGRPNGFLARIGGRGEAPRVTLEIPRGLRVSIRGSVAAGLSRLELGGLAVEHVGLRLWAGAHAVTFSEPLAEPLVAMELELRAGQLRVDGLGNASPLTTIVRGAFGETAVDLGGVWSRDGHVEATQSGGTLRLRVPQSVAVDVERLHVGFGDLSGAPLVSAPVEGGVPRPRVRLSAEASFGSIEVSRGEPDPPEPGETP